MPGDIPTPLDRNTSSGQNALRGFGFQDEIILALLPEWLAQHGFSRLIREYMGDCEAEFFVPKYGLVVEFVEIKKERLTPDKFWDEIDMFQRMSAASPNRYRLFRLVTGGYSEAIEPLRNGLRRVKDPFEFYKEDDAIADAAYAAFEKIVLNLRRSKEDAKFLFTQVRLEDDYVQGKGRGIFQSSLTQYLPEYDVLSGNVQGNIYNSLGILIEGRLNIPFSRSEIVHTMHQSIPESERPSPRTITMLTSTMPSVQTQAIRFDWQEFFGGTIRQYPNQQAWDDHVVRQLRETVSWAKQHRSERRITLTGERRLTTAIAIGAVFSAVTGFSIEMTHRDGSLWATDAHPDASTIEYRLTLITSNGGSEQDLIVTIGILGSIAEEVTSARSSLGIDGFPSLDIYGGAIESPQHANKAAAAIKDAIRQELNKLGATNIHLFYKGPSHVALFLGHRLNAIVSGFIQCYEWVGPGKYVPTCRIDGA